MSRTYRNHQSRTKSRGERVVSNSNSNSNSNRDRSFRQFQLVVHDRVTDDEADRGTKLELDRTDIRRYDCAEHGTVVPLPNSYRCPYCLPVAEDEHSFAVTVGSSVVLNPS